MKSIMIALIVVASAGSMAVTDAAEVPFEAKIENPHNLSRALMRSLAVVVIANGYRCDSISGVRSRVSARRAFLLHCNNHYYTYEVRDAGGRLTVRVK